MSSTYCTPAEVAAQFIYMDEFTNATDPSLELVNTFIAEGGLDLERALAYGLYETNAIGGIDSTDVDAYAWMKKANIQGTLYRLGQYIWALVTAGRRERASIPYQEEWPKMLEDLRESRVNLQTSEQRFPFTPIVPTPTQTIQIAWGWSLDDTAQADEFPDSGKSATGHLTIPPLPSGESSAFALLWTADSFGTPTGVMIPMSLSTLAIFGSPTPLELDSKSGHVRVSGFRQGAGDVGKDAQVMT